MRHIRPSKYIVAKVCTIALSSLLATWTRQKAQLQSLDTTKLFKENIDDILVFHVKAIWSVGVLNPGAIKCESNSLRIFVVTLTIRRYAVSNSNLLLQNRMMILPLTFPS